jgi:hypothetical protein
MVVVAASTEEEEEEDDDDEEEEEGSCSMSLVAVEERLLMAATSSPVNETSSLSFLRSLFASIEIACTTALSCGSSCSRDPPPIVYYIISYLPIITVIIYWEGTLFFLFCFFCFFCFFFCFCFCFCFCFPLIDSNTNNKE